MVTFTINIPPMLALIYNTWIRHGYPRMDQIFGFQGF